jgi:hypothetical protein
LPCIVFEYSQDRSGFLFGADDTGAAFSQCALEAVVELGVRVVRGKVGLSRFDRHRIGDALKPEAATADRHGDGDDKQRQTPA